jgi:hypothetical protein
LLSSNDVIDEGSEAEDDAVANDRQQGPAREEVAKKIDSSNTTTAKLDIRRSFEAVVKAREMIDVDEAGAADIKDNDEDQADQSTPPPPASKPRVKSQTVYPSSYPLKVQIDKDEVEAEKERIKMEVRMDSFLSIVTSTFSLCALSPSWSITPRASPP